MNSIDNTLYHEFGAEWEWKLNRHLDLRLAGWIMAPADGVKDLASSMDCNGSRCDGEDVALGGEVRVRGRF